MKNSNSLGQNCSVNQDSDCQVPKEWDYISKRLTQVQKGLTILSKKHSKLEKKFVIYTQQSNQLNADITQQILNIKSSIPTHQDFKEDLLKDFQIIEKQIKNSCSQSIAIRFEQLSLNVQERNNSIQIKIRTIYDQAKTYVDRAVFQLKQLLKKYVKQQGDLQRKIQKTSRQNSPSLLPKSLNKSTSAKKLHQSTQKTQGYEKQLQASNNNWFEKSRSSLNKQSISSVNGNGNRVSYLRQKLKQFQKINKKYEGQSQKMNRKQQSQDIVKKMKNYRQYLQQSQSQLQPSNILSPQQMTQYQHAHNTKKNNYSLF